jgi:hypothetical protein
MTMTVTALIAAARAQRPADSALGGAVRLMARNAG